MNSTTILEQEGHTSESRDPTSTNSTEKVSHQTEKQQSNHQTTSPRYSDPTHLYPAKTNQLHQPAHLSLTKISAGLPHHQTKTPPPSPDIDDLRHQTHTVLASLLFCRNNKRPQQIWHLRLLQLQQQRCLSDLTRHQHPLLPNQPITLDPNESLVIYTTPCAELHQPLAVLEDLEGLAVLEDLEDLEGPADPESLRDPLQQYLQQLQPETQMTGLWEIYLKYSTENEQIQGTSSTQS
jgi:hypothetical protein